MRLKLLALLVPLALAGCLSVSSDSPPAPRPTTVVVPSGPVVCPGGGAPPC